MTIKAIHFQDVIHKFPIDIFADHIVLKSGLTSMQDSAESCLYSDLVREPPRLELISSFLLEHIDELFVMGNESLVLHLTSLALLERKYKWI